MSAIQMAPKSTFQAEAVAVWVQLRDALLQLTAVVQSPWRRKLVPDSALSGFDTFIKTAGPKSVEQLSPSGALTMRVVRGEKSATWWAEQARSVQNTLGDIAKFFGESLPSWERVSSEIILPTLQTATDGAKKALNTGADLVPWVAAALIALVVGYVVFTFRR